MQSVSMLHSDVFIFLCIHLATLGISSYSQFCCGISKHEYISFSLCSTSGANDRANKFSISLDNLDSTIKLKCGKKLLHSSIWRKFINIPTMKSLSIARHRIDFAEQISLFFSFSVFFVFFVFFYCFSLILNRISSISRMLGCLTTLGKITECLLATFAGPINWWCGAGNILDVQIRKNHARTSTNAQVRL